MEINGDTVRQIAKDAKERALILKKEENLKKAKEYKKRESASEKEAKRVLPFVLQDIADAAQSGESYYHYNYHDTQDYAFYYKIVELLTNLKFDVKLGVHSDINYADDGYAPDGPTTYNFEVTF